MWSFSSTKYRYPLDPFDRIWDADRSFTPFHVATGFKMQLSFNQSSLVEKPPSAVLQTGRVLARRNMLTYNLPLDALGDYYVILYFAGILPVFPSFDVIINGELVKSNYTINSSETSALYVTRKAIRSLNITLKSISFYPQINAFEVYKMVDIPSDASSTTGCSPICLTLNFILILAISTNYSLFHLIILLLNLNTSISTSGYSAIHRIGSWMARWSMPSFTVGENWLRRKPCYIIVCAVNSLPFLLFSMY